MVDANYQAQSSSSPVQGGYVQPSPGITEAIVTLGNDAGVSAFGTAGTASAAVLTVQGIASGTPVQAKLYRDSTVTAQASAKATSPGALGTVATVTPGVAGLWEVSGAVAISGTTVATADSHNAQLRQTSTAVLTNIPIGVQSTTGSDESALFGPVVLNLSAVDTVNVVSVGAATTGAIYAAEIICRLVG